MITSRQQFTAAIAALNLSRSQPLWRLALDLMVTMHPWETESIQTSQ